MNKDIKQLVEDINKLSNKDLNELLNNINIDNNGEYTVQICDREPSYNEIFVGDFLYDHIHNDLVSQRVEDIIMECHIKEYDRWYFEDFNIMGNHKMVVIRFEGINVSGVRESEITDKIYKAFIGKCTTFDADGGLIAITSI